LPFAFFASASQAAIVVTDTGTASAGTCTLAQAIHAANRANNPDNTTPAGATTVAPLSHSATTDAGTCAGAAAGPNTIQLPPAATIGFSSDAVDNYWYGPNALPPIASTIVIEGAGSTLSITIGTSPRLRFFFIGADPAGSATPGYNTPGPGVLTLRHLTLRGGRQVGGASSRGGAGAGLGGAVFNQGTLTLDAVTLTDNQAIGGSTNITEAFAGGGMGSNGSGGGGSMGGPVPQGSTDAGLNGTLATGAGGAGGGIPNGMGGDGSHNNTGIDGPGGNGAGGGGGSGPNSIYNTAGGGGGFGGGPGGLSVRVGASGLTGAGSFGNGATTGSGGGGGVGGGGGDSSNSLAAGGGGFGAGGGAATFGGKGGFGGGGGAGSAGLGGFGGGTGFPNPGANGGGGAGMGGALFNHAGSMLLVNCTLTGNAARGGRSGTGSQSTIEGNGGSGFGGAIFNLDGAVTVRYSTLAGNTVSAGLGRRGNGAAAGGAIYSLAYNANAAAGSSSAGATLENSILANSVGGSDLVVDQPANVANGAANAATANTAAAGGNLVMTGAAANGAPALPTFPLNADPMLAPLADNGGPSHTLALNVGSPAINAADACSGTLPDTDQRGYVRRIGVAPDLGAYESGSVPNDRLFADGFDAAPPRCP
jgi:hypothetical protein